MLQKIMVVNRGSSDILQVGDVLVPWGIADYLVYRAGVICSAGSKDSPYPRVSMISRKVVTTPVVDSQPIANTNPKAAFGDKKIPVFLVPLTFIYGVAVALFEGASKYGKWNWRRTPVEASTYVHATGRHLLKWYHGEDKDPVTRIHHLYNAAASLCILIDAEVAKTLIDDRPPKVDMTEQAQYLEDTIAHLKELFKDATPTHCKEQV